MSVNVVMNKIRGLLLLMGTYFHILLLASIFFFEALLNVIVKLYNPSNVVHFFNTAF